MEFIVVLRFPRLAGGKVRLIKSTAVDNDYQINVISKELKNANVQR